MLMLAMWPTGRAVSAVAATLTAAAIAGCGGSRSHRTGTAARSSQLALAECMRARGAPNFPDPTKGPGGEGFSITTTPGSPIVYVDGRPFSGPAFESAVKQCKLFGGGTAPPPISESQKLAMLAFAQCMRRHGIAGFPDPTFPSGGGVARRLPPGLNRDSPAMKRAARACGKP
jgi:hypothetical protein